MDTVDRELRRALRGRDRGPGKRVAADLRASATAYALRRRREGVGLRELSAELGLAAETLRRWTLATPERALLPGRGRQRTRPVPVTIIEAVPASGRTVSVVSPGGFRVDGLSLEEAATLLRALA